ncbi:MAG: adenylate/guanylate cyclase domain-containing protein [Synechococcaceae cyanobacterium]|nr:adenylate/guanylate cyclase domain-containing protein [Synechococcaceae cyanobacterium]
MAGLRHWRLRHWTLPWREQTPAVRCGRILRGWARALVPYGAAALLLFGLRQSQVAEAVDLQLYDLMSWLRPRPPLRPSPLLVIGLSELDIAAYGWPIDDRLLCRAIRLLSRDGAAAIGLDLYRDRGVGPDQDCLRREARTNPRLVSIFNAADAIEAIPGTPAHRRAYNDLVVDPDGVVRRDLVHVAGQDSATVALPLRLVQIARGAAWLPKGVEDGRLPGFWLTPRSGGYDRLDAAGYQQMLPFRPPGSLPTFSLAQLLNGSVPPEAVRGRFVLIGSTAASLRDTFLVPQSRFQSGASKYMMPGVEVHGQRLLALLDRLERGDPGIRVLPDWAERLLLPAGLLLGVLLGERRGSLRQSLLAVLISVLALAALGLALQPLASLWIGTTLPLLGLTLMAVAGWVRRGAASSEQRQQIERLLGQTTSPAVARQLWDQRDTLLADGRFEGRQLPVTVIFSDLRGFTTVSEQLPPAALLAWINRGMACCVPAISRRGGMVNKFTGDGMMAVFGAPISRGEQQDARDALASLLEIRAGMETLNQQLAAEGAPPMRMRLGVHSGTVLAGSMGSSERLEYAIIGDAVNCASRIESLERDRHEGTCRILVSGHTFALLYPQAPVPESALSEGASQAGAGRDVTRPDGTGPQAIATQPLAPERSASEAITADGLHWRCWGAYRVKGRLESLVIWELREGPGGEEPQGCR